MPVPNLHRIQQRKTWQRGSMDLGVSFEVRHQKNSDVLRVAKESQKRQPRLPGKLGCGVLPSGQRLQFANWKITIFNVQIH